MTYINTVARLVPYDVGGRLAGVVGQEVGDERLVLRQGQERVGDIDVQGLEDRQLECNTTLLVLLVLLVLLLLVLLLLVLLLLLSRVGAAVLVVLARVGRHRDRLDSRLPLEGALVKIPCFVLVAGVGEMRSW